MKECNLQIKERPILFSTPMVQAIMEGRKTVTRRIKGLDKLNERPEAWRFDGVNRNGDYLFYDVHGFVSGHDPQDCTVIIKCPYGKAGDILWVRETWAKVNGEIAYKASEKDYLFAPGETNGIWKPSIHMKKKDCRLKLEIVSVSVERLHEITKEDAIKEGILYYDDEIMKSRRYKDYLSDASEYGHPDHDYPTVVTAKESFASLWQSINGKESWDCNPWVWVVNFRKL